MEVVASAQHDVAELGIGFSVDRTAYNAGRLGRNRQVALLFGRQLLDMLSSILRDTLTPIDEFDIAARANLLKLKRPSLSVIAARN